MSVTKTLKIIVLLLCLFFGIATLFSPQPITKVEFACWWLITVCFIGMNILSKGENIMNSAVKINEKKKIKSAAINTAIEYMMIAFIQFLGDKRGWKQKTICEAIKYCVNHAEAIVGDYTTLEEARQDVWENYGIKFENGRIYAEEREGL